MTKPDVSEDIYHMVSSSMNMAEFIHQSAESMSLSHDNSPAIKITLFLDGLSAVAKKISTELNDVANILMSGEEVHP